MMDEAGAFAKSITKKPVLTAGSYTPETALKAVEEGNGFGNEVRPQARLRCVSWGAGRLWRDKSVPRFPPSFPVFSIRSHLFATVPIPSSTQNAPGFAFFWLNRVRFSLFRCFLAAKFLSWFLCNLPHSAHKLKPSVIPCKREVSFLT